MLAVHRIFQMIFGIIVSFTFLYFLITYSGNYANTQKELQRGEILKAFADEAGSVYLTGIATNFSYFSHYDFSSCFVKAPEKGMPEIDCPGTDAPAIQVGYPLLFQPGGQVYIGKASLDYSWWVFNFAEAMPSTLFVFNPVESNDEAWETMKILAEYLPDTSDDWSAVSVDFAFCDGPDILYICGGKPCSKSDFLSILDSGHEGLSFSRCTTKLGANMRLVTIANYCSPEFAQSGACIIPPNSKGVGNTYMTGSAKAYVWKDPADLVALSLGGSQKDDFGITAGEKIYKYKNSVLMERLSLAAKIISKRSALIAGKVPECGSLYADLSNALDRIPGKDYASVSDMNDLNGMLSEAKGIWQGLSEKGCERMEYGM